MTGPSLGEVRPPGGQAAPVEAGFLEGVCDCHSQMLSWCQRQTMRGTGHSACCPAARCRSRSTFCPPGRGPIAGIGKSVFWEGSSGALPLPSGPQRGENVFCRINSGSISTASKFWSKNICRTHGYLEVPILGRKFQWASVPQSLSQMSLPGLGSAGERASAWTSGKLGTGNLFLE